MLKENLELFAVIKMPPQSNRITN